MVRTDALHEMAADLGAEVARNFALLYLDMLDDRLEKLRTALAADDPAATLTSAVSLHTASWMVGADGMAEAVRGLADLARRQDLAGARHTLPALEELVPAVALALRQAISDLT
ncbi:Hpt domain-containing protein [Georgenia subflava]|uniref:HPt domain-containing protein n=1 Tax=Georgenia subflava TaxID=1622177 RepID=A0A6N7EHW6_9MICO|nr:Hpt domain-containing protein [Georgenia subflava]MPV37982.1 hypothetical protein [Georgenia subflava]